MSCPERSPRISRVIEPSGNEGASWNSSPCCFSGKPLWMWLLFIGIVIALLVFDLGVLHKDDHEIGVARKPQAFRASTSRSASPSAAGSGGRSGRRRAAQYLTGFVVEKTLAMDNVFVIALIFSYFAIPRIYQHRVLFWGILGVIVLRGIMIGARRDAGRRSIAGCSTSSRPS